MSDEESENAMEVLLVLDRQKLANAQPNINTKTVSEAILSTFGRGLKIIPFDKYFVVEFQNKNKALKALEQGLLIDLSKIDFITMYEYFLTL